MYTRICTAESFPCPPEPITTLLISYTPVRNKKFFCFFFLMKGCDGVIRCIWGCPKYDTASQVKCEMLAEEKKVCRVVGKS